jgi:hypothetical protein
LPRRRPSGGSTASSSNLSDRPGRSQIREQGQPTVTKSSQPAAGKSASPVVSLKKTSLTGQRKKRNHKQ